MRPLALLLPVACVAVSACHSEPTFDERYEKAEKNIRSTAGAIDAELAPTEPSPTEGHSDPASSGSQAGSGRSR
ncbi:hypothetical protein MKP08_02230 [Erythrobacter sp. LQ02-29]|uniref:hypothetical protein n=1 Tax=Erythrobacter sp. LQ02-29 TaxID=2920384 RepID=UPI001F4E585F|nr:hypothetical protein [Erythrobacter sp. LQ02-29]MCP9221566.1 hypothetical protein [Erythrobacter sp. LQ02-29]